MQPQSHHSHPAHHETHHSPHHYAAYKSCHRFLAMNYVNLVHKTQPIFHAEHGWVIEFSVTGHTLKTDGIVFENTNNPNFHFYKLHDCRVNAAGPQDDIFPSSQPVTDILQTGLYTQLAKSSVVSSLQMSFTFNFDISVTDPITKFDGINKTVFMKVCFPVHH